MRQLGARMPELPALDEVPEDHPTRTPAPAPEEPTAVVDETVVVPPPEPPVRVPGRARISERVQPAVTETQAAHAQAAPAPEPGVTRPVRPQDPEPVGGQEVSAAATQRTAPSEPARPHYGDELPFRKLGRPRFEELAGEPRGDELRFDDVRFRHVQFQDALPEADAPQPEPSVRAGSILGLSTAYEPRLSSRSRSLLDDEPRHHFPFMTFVVPGLAAMLALGALAWSGSLRDRVHDQDAAVNQLREQNQRLEDALDQISRENGTPAQSTAHGKALPTTSSPANAQDLVPPPSQLQQAPVASQQQTAGASAAPTSASTTPPSTKPAAQDSGASRSATATAPAADNSDSIAKSAPSEPLTGRSTPPPMSGRAHRADAGYHPQLVAPYPTTFQPQNVASDGGKSQPAPNPGLYVKPNESSPAKAPVTPTVPRTPARPTNSAAAVPYHPPFTVTDTGARGASASPEPQYTATSSGAYVSPLAQNIETVENLQRHSTVPLQEFHAREGLLTRVAPTLGVTVDRVDPGHGSYGLLVRSGAGTYQLHGQVDAPVIMSDSATNQQYELVVLRIADQQVYGYVKPAH